MKLRSDRAPFAEAVRWCVRHVPSRPAVPALAGLLLHAEEGRLRLTGFDYEAAGRAEADAETAEPGTALVPGRLLAEITRALPDAPVELSTSGGRMELACGGARFTLPTMPVEDYPTAPEPPPTVGAVDAAVFAHAVGQTAVAAGRDDTLPTLTGVEMSMAPGGLFLQATDRYRMALRDVVWTPALDEPVTALVPARILGPLAKSLGRTDSEVTLGASADGSGTASLVGFTAGGRSTVTRVLDGKLPDLRRLVADDYPAVVRVHSAPLLAAAGRAALVADRSVPLRLCAERGSLVVEAGGGSDAGARESLSCAYDGPAVTLAFTPGYLLDAVGAVAAPVTVFGVDGSPRVLVTGESEDGALVEGCRHMLSALRTDK